MQSLSFAKYTFLKNAFGGIFWNHILPAQTHSKSWAHFQLKPMENFVSKLDTVKPYFAIPQQCSGVVYFNVALTSMLGVIKMYFHTELLC